MRWNATAVGDGSTAYVARECRRQNTERFCSCGRTAASSHGSAANAATLRHTSGVPAAVADTGDFEESVVDVGPPLDSTHVADDDCAAPAVVDISSIGEGDDSRSCHIDTDCNEEQVSFVFY